MAVARAKGRLRGKQLKLSGKQESHLVELYRAGGHTIAELGELFGVTRSTDYRAIPAGPDHYDFAGPHQRVNAHVFVDETKERDYLLVAATVAAGDLDRVRARMRGLTLPGLHRMHMKKESDPRKRAVAAAICRTGVQATIYQAGRQHRSELDARAACLRAAGLRRGRPCRGRTRTGTR